MRAEYLNIWYNLAHGLTEPPIARNVGEHRRRQTDENDEKVTDGQVHNENVRDGAHVRVLGHHNDHEQVADDADHKDRKGEHEQTPLERVRIEVVVELTVSRILFARRCHNHIL